MTARAAQEQVPCSALRFSQREVRAALGWQDRALRRQLARLVELEYLVVYRTGCGNQKEYQWWSPDAVDTADTGAVLGLTDAAHLSRRTTLRPGPPVPQAGGSALDPVEPAPNRHRKRRAPTPCEIAVKSGPLNHLRGKPAPGAQNEGYLHAKHHPWNGLPSPFVAARPSP